MALGTPTLLVNSSGGASGASQVTAAVTPTGDALLLAVVGARAGATLASEPTLSNSGGYTWTPIVSGVLDAGSGVRVRARLFSAVAPGSPASTTFTGACTSAAKVTVGVVQVTGADASITNFDEGTNSNGDPTIVLPVAPAASSLALGFFVAGGTGAITPAASLGTELSEWITNTDLNSEIAYKLGTPPTTWSWSTTNSNTVALGVEVKEATAGGVAPVRFRTAVLA